MARSEALLLVPGAFCDARLFAHQLAHLQEVSAPRVAELADVADVGAMAEAILATAPERFALAGLSLGGTVALEIVRRAAERITRLALIASTIEPDPPEVTTIRERSIARVRAGSFTEQVETVLPFLIGPDARVRDDLRGVVRDMALGVGPERYVRQLTAIMRRPDQRELVGGITVPTLALCGRDDVVTTPSSHAELVAAMPRARHALVEQAGHLVPLEQPAATTALLRDWLLYDD